MPMFPKRRYARSLTGLSQNCQPQVIIRARIRPLDSPRIQVRNSTCVCKGVPMRKPKRATKFDFILSPGASVRACVGNRHEPSTGTDFHSVAHFYWLPNGWEISVWALIQDTAGNLYGTTLMGGAFGGGTIFKLDANGHETVLFNFFPRHEERLWHLSLCGSAPRWSRKPIRYNQRRAATQPLRGFNNPVNGSMLACLPT
jgi:uncharacterized repeat protein (TIGR03803 family)